MPVRVKVRAVIWIDDQIAVHRIERRGQLHVTLPGGRVNERESVTTALHREVREELGVEIVIGDLLFAAEVHSGARRQDVELVFNASLRDLGDRERIEVVDPTDPGAEVLPPVLGYLSPKPGPPGERRWLGNLYVVRPRDGSP
jgi:ADP-ribose pyrophosphatase YjhB (NUDIX family)